MSLAAVPAAAAPPEEAPAPRARFCCALGKDLEVRLGPIALPIRLRNVLSVRGLGFHRYASRLPIEERNGLVYTCRGGLIDVGHVRATVDRTAYFYVNGGGGRAELDVVGGRAVFVHTATSAEARRLVSAKAAFDLAVWHEQATFEGIDRRPYFSEDFSAFSPEDLYSDLLGALIGMRALASPLPFEAAADAEIAAALESLGAVDARRTDAALDRLQGRWWRGDVAVPFGELLMEQRYDRTPPLAPWRLEAHGAEAIGCTRTMARTLAFADTASASYALDVVRNEAQPSAAPARAPWVPALRLQSIRLLPVEVFAGGAGASSARPTFGFRVRGGEAHTWGGDLRIIRFATTYDSDERGVAFNIVGIEASSMFFCREADTDRLHAPISAWFASCAPGGAGLGGRLLQMQYDGRTGRTVLRPIELTFDLDVLRTAFLPAFLYRHLVVSAGLGADSVLLEAGDDVVVPRAVAAARLVLGDEAGRWTLRARSAYRQSIVELADFGVESSVTLSHRVFLGAGAPRRHPVATLVLGLEAGHAHWRFSERSMADEAPPVISARERNTWFGLLSLGARFEALTF